MQAGGGCGGRTVKFGVYRLVTVFVLKLMGDVGRQRHLAQTVKNLFPDPVIEKADQTVSVLHHFLHLRMQKTVSKHQSGAGSCFLSGLYQAFPHIARTAFEQQHLHRAAGLLAHAHKPGRNYPGIV